MRWKNTDGKRLNEVHPRICTNQPDYRFEESVMNKLYAFYCRAYQAVFRAALPILPYREPIQLDGLSSIVPLLAEKRIASVLLVTDASVRSPRPDERAGSRAQGGRHRLRRL